MRNGGREPPGPQARVTHHMNYTRRTTSQLGAFHRISDASRVLFRCDRIGDPKYLSGSPDHKTIRCTQKIYHQSAGFPPLRKTTGL